MMLFALQVSLRELDMGGTIEKWCDASNMLTGTIPSSWGSWRQLTRQGSSYCIFCPV
jgi:hypothetical protein